MDINILNELKRTNGLIEADIINIEKNIDIERFISPFFTALFWDKYRDVNPTLFEMYSKNIFDFLISNYIVGEGWHFFPDKRNYPTDTDDTSVIARFLLNNNRLSIEKLKEIQQILINNKAGENNFYVWIKKNEYRKSNIVDPIVNINILDFLVLSQKINENKLSLVENVDFYLSSKYYISNSVSLWFLFNSVYVSCNKEQRSEVIKKLYNNNLLNFDYLSLNFIVQDAVQLLPQTITIYKYPMINWFKHSSSEIGYKCLVLEEFEKEKLLTQLKRLDKQSTVPNIVYK